MKIAIKGHSTRGHEIIQILESLGGIKSILNGEGIIYTYYIDENNIIRYGRTPIDYKVYTLEEFEKEFPFKVGDKVQTNRHGEPAEVIKMYLNPACGIAYKVRYKSGVELQHCPENLKFYKEMKEERNITLTLEKAKEWYKKGGELREIALQAFTEKELNPLPRSWEEFITNRSISGYYISGNGKPLACCSSGKLSSPHVCPSKKSAEAHLAMIQLEQLRDCWRQGWKPTEYNTGHCITHYYNQYTIMSFCFISFLSFPTNKMAEEFLECFKDLIEEAGDLI